VPNNCNDFGFGPTQNVREPRGTFYATEHILELQTVANFLDEMNSEFGRGFPDFSPNASPLAKQTFCQVLRNMWQQVRGDLWFSMDGVARRPIQHLLQVMPGNDNSYTNEFVLLEAGVNSAKMGVGFLLPN
jgi:chitinase